MGLLTPARLLRLNLCGTQAANERSSVPAAKQGLTSCFHGDTELCAGVGGLIHSRALGHKLLASNRKKAGLIRKGCSKLLAANEGLLS